MTEHTNESTVSYELPTEKTVTPTAEEPSRSEAIRTMIFGIVSAALSDQNPIVGLIFAIMTLKGLKAKMAAAKGTGNENFFMIANITSIVGLVKSISAVLTILFVIGFYIFMMIFAFTMAALESGGVIS